MKKNLLALAVLVGTTFSNFAQTTSSASSPSKEGGKFSIGFEGGLPIGGASDLFSVVVGGSLKYELPTAKNTFFTISAGYNNFILKSEFKDLGPTSGVIPVKAGIKYYAEDGFFLEGQAGIAFSTVSGGGTSFVFSPGIGYTFNGGFEAGVRYEGWPKDGATTSQIGLRLAYRF